MSVIRLTADTTGMVWQLLKRPGDEVRAEEAVLIIESMKMEIPVLAPVAGRVVELRVEKDQVVAEGDVVAVLEPAR